VSPYADSVNLPFESASKLGHLSVIEDPLVKELLKSFQKVERGEATLPEGSVQQLDLGLVEPLGIVLAVDGSLSSVPNSLIEDKTLAYVKVAALCLSLDDLEAAEAPIVDPAFVQGLVKDHTNTFSTVLPLNNVIVSGQTMRETVREVVHRTFETVNEGRLLDTLVYLTSRGWLEHSEHDASFACPFCARENALPRHKTQFECPRCGKTLSVVDYLGFEREVNEESNEDAVARSLMLALEHLAVIDYLRRMRDKNPAMLKRTLLLKDGPLMLPGQYSRLAEAIRSYLNWLHREGVEYYLAGVEKSGAFVTHAHYLGEALRAPGRVFVPGNGYILSRIKHMDPGATKYGERVLYGSKALVGLDERNVTVLNVPTPRFMLDPTTDDLIGLPRIVKTLTRLVSRQHQDALMPIVAVNRLASMSFYPSNDILAKYAGSMVAGPRECE